jgi:hypothetical protein
MNPAAASMPPALAPGARRYALGAALSLGLGALAWSQVCVGPLEVELASASTRLGLVSLYLAPLLLLVLGLALRRPWLAQGGFLLSLLPCFAVMPAADARALQAGQDALTLAASAVAFTLYTARLTAPTPTRAQPTKQAPTHQAPLTPSPPLTFTPAHIDRRFWRLARLAAPRLALTLALFTTPLVALYSDRGQAQLRDSFPHRPSDAAFLIHLIHLLLASVATYVALLSPSINRTLDAYALREALRATRTHTYAKRLRRSLTLCALALPPLAAAWWWLSTH